METLRASVRSRERLAQSSIAEYQECCALLLQVSRLALVAGVCSDGAHTKGVDDALEHPSEVEVASRVREVASRVRARLRKLDDSLSG
jgi:hypothetical protein